MTDNPQHNGSQQRIPGTIRLTIDELTVVARVMGRRPFVDDVDLADLLVESGERSLVARDLLRIEDGQVLVPGPVQYISAALENPQAYALLALNDGEGSPRAVRVLFHEAAAFIEESIYTGVFVFSPLDIGAIGDFLLSVLELDSEGPESAADLETATIIVSQDGDDLTPHFPDSWLNPRVNSLIVVGVDENSAHSLSWVDEEQKLWLIDESESQPDRWVAKLVRRSDLVDLVRSSVAPLEALEIVSGAADGQ